MAHRTLIIFFLILGWMLPQTALQAQEKYRISPYPDFWYNDVDGVRFGIRLLGEMEGNFQEGPHRIDLGVWGGSKLPDMPVSYYVSLTEPIPSITEYAQEGSIQFISSVRTGFAQHRVQLNKRFQNGFDEYDNVKIHMYLSFENMFDDEYRPYPALWENGWRSLLGIGFERNLRFERAKISGIFNFEHNLNKETGKFSTGTVELRQIIRTSEYFTLRLREFGGINFGDYNLDNAFLFSMPSAREQLGFGFSRAKGTIPESWFSKGIFQFHGGANLRGYVKQEVQSLEIMNSPGFNGEVPFSEKIWAANVDLEFSNPINTALKKKAIIGDFMEFRSYLFFDIGQSMGIAEIEPQVSFPGVAIPDAMGEFEEKELLMDSGIGLQISFNIPDYLANDRGLFLRYEVPFWLSSPEAGDSNFKYRNLIGIGAIFSF